MPGAEVSMQSRHSKSAGFTLIEILIVIGLIALVTAVAVPSLTNVFRASAESFAKQTALLLRCGVLCAIDKATQQRSPILRRPNESDAVRGP